MKCAIFYTVALACCIGLALADWDSYGYGNVGYGLGGYGGKASYVPVPYYQGAGAKGGFGNGGILAMLGFLFIFFFLFGNTSSQDQIILLNSTLEG